MLAERTLQRKPERSWLSETRERVRNTPVCLITPDSDFLLDSRVFPFIGILKVASMLEANGNPVYVLDLSKYKNQEDIISDFIASHPQVKHFGITATTPQIPAAVRVRNRIKDLAPDSSVILGGPHVTMTDAGAKVNPNGRAPEALRRLTNLFDRLVLGDGELAIFPAIDIQNPEKTIDAADMRKPLYLHKNELEDFPFPARHLIDHNSYKYYIKDPDDDKPYRAFSVIGQLGCPFECGFCCGRNSFVLRNPRTRSIASVIKEIEQVVRDSEKYEEPLRGVMFYDDELNAVKGGLKDLCHGLIDLQKRLGVEMRFRGFVKADLFSQEQADLMYQAGFRVLLSGVESGSDKILNAMKKRTSRKINSDCVKFAHNVGLKFKSLMSIGHPGESKDTIAESVEWALSNLKEGDDIDWTIITQYPGSPYYDLSVKAGDSWLYTINEERLWSKDVDFVTESEFYKGKPGDYTAYVWTDHLDRHELVSERDKAEKETRDFLNLPELKSIPEMQYEHSMGQGLPANILRKSTGAKLV